MQQNLTQLVQTGCMKQNIYGYTVKHNLFAAEHKRIKHNAAKDKVNKIYTSWSVCLVDLESRIFSVSHSFFLAAQEI